MATSILNKMGEEHHQECDLLVPRRPCHLYYNFRVSCYETDMCYLSNSIC